MSEQDDEELIAAWRHWSRLLDEYERRFGKALAVADWGALLKLLLQHFPTSAVPRKALQKKPAGRPRRDHSEAHRLITEDVLQRYGGTREQAFARWLEDEGLPQRLAKRLAKQFKGIHHKVTKARK